MLGEGSVLGKGSVIAGKTIEEKEEEEDPIGPSCSMANESKVPGNYGSERVHGGVHCNCDARKGHKYSYSLPKDPMTGNTGSTVNLKCYGQDGEPIEGGTSWSIPNTDNPGGRSGDNYDWLRYKKWVEDGGIPGKMHSNPINN